MDNVAILCIDAGFFLTCKLRILGDAVQYNNVSWSLLHVCNPISTISVASSSAPQSDVQHPVSSIVRFDPFSSWEHFIKTSSHVPRLWSRWQTQTIASVYGNVGNVTRHSFEHCYSICRLMNIESLRVIGYK